MQPRLPLSPLLSNLALSVLDEHFAAAWEAMGNSHAREQRRRKGLAKYRLVRYADDFVVLEGGGSGASPDRAAPVGDEDDDLAHRRGFDFLGFRIRRHKKRGAAKRHLYTYPSRAAVAAVKGKVRALTQEGTNQPLEVLLHQLNPVLRGWTNYFRHGASSKTFAYLDAFTWRRVWRWLRRKHPQANVKELRRRYLAGGWWPTQDVVTLFKPAAVAITRYRYRHGAIPSPWTTAKTEESGP